MQEYSFVAQEESNNPFLKSRIRPLGYETQEACFSGTVLEFDFV